MRVMLLVGLCLFSPRIFSQTATLEIGDGAAPGLPPSGFLTYISDLVDDTRLGGYYNITARIVRQYGNHKVVACTFTTREAPDSNQGIALVALSGGGEKAKLTDYVILGTEGEKLDLANGFTELNRGVTYKISCTLADTAVVVSKRYDYSVPVTGAYRYETVGAMDAEVVYRLGNDGTFMSPVPVAKFTGRQMSETVGRLLLIDMLPETSREAFDMKLDNLCGMMIDAAMDNKKRTNVSMGIYYHLQRLLYNVNPDEYINWIYNTNLLGNDLPMVMLEDSCFSNCISLGDLADRVKKLKDKKERKFFQSWLKERFDIK